MNAKKLSTKVIVALLAVGIASAASAFEFRGGARTSVNGGNWRGGANQANVAARQSAYQANVETRQSNRTEREGNRQNGVQQVSSNRNNTAQNISNNRTNVVNNYNNNNHGCCYNNGGWYDDHPVATAAAVTATVVATAAIVGSIVHTLPPSCAPVMVNGATYQQCGSTWYQPQYYGTSVQYVVVNAP
ncbi:hypothetical protein [Caballeronia glebae]|uniref:Lipoprotein n=1 Tax=Caballeronia glebae TaxID=1777143 RepID=A0A158BYF9_9BURK|nr:hypothetical protein [Caballeronia glebae]SAK75134.1 hypothetical protein AWB82_04751 [Caballeronia glebae]